VARYPKGSDVRVFEKYMNDGDYATVGKGGGGQPSYTYRGNGGTFTVAPFALLGIEDDDLSECVRMERELNDQIEYEGWKQKISVTQICGQVMRECQVNTKQLPIKFRRLSHEAIHQGPMVVCSGGSKNAVQYDRKQAFLKALYQDVPVPGTHTSVSPKWARVRKSDGIVRARVKIRDDTWYGKIPPLPVRRNGYTIYPTGEFSGVWTVPHLRLAEEMSVEVLEVFEAIGFRVDKLHAKAAERIENVQSKNLRKLIYTRYWGKLASQGGWKGTKSIPDGLTVNDVHRFRFSSLFWIYDGIDIDTAFDASKDYMPDHSAYIAGRNSEQMAIALCGVKPYDTIASHVDAIWTKGSDDFGDGFAVKSEGPLRFYGVGTYNHNGKLAAQGLEGDFDENDLRNHAANMRDWSRDWHFDINPGVDFHASSDPISLAIDRHDVSYKSVYDKSWTPNGWLAPKESKNERQDPEGL
jgi:hypothetical protein